MRGEELMQGHAQIFVKAHSVTINSQVDLVHSPIPGYY